MVTKEVENIVKKVIRKDLHKEALDLLNNTSPFRIHEFVRYYNEDQHNICCMLLDTIKMELVYFKLMEQKDTDEFGKDYHDMFKTLTKTYIL